MHEVSLAMGLIELVVEDAAGRGLRQVDVLEVTIGDWSGVNPEALRFAFLALRPGTLCQSADLAISFAAATAEMRITAYQGR